MIKLSYYEYVLTPFTTLNAVSAGLPRRGALIKVEWPQGFVGYGDLHPWPELGDTPLDDQLAALKKGRISAQVEQTIWLARKDANLRKKGKTILTAGEKVRNNFLVSNSAEIVPGFLDELKRQSYSTIKLKVGRDLAAEATAITRMAAAGFKIRLDFNGTGSWQIFEKFFSGLTAQEKVWIEYVEDPFPYDADTWADAKKLVKVACDAPYEKVDWENSTKVPFDILVIKPAKMDVDKAIERCKKFNLKATVTSYMDHPVGSMGALAVAMECKELYPNIMLDAGCLTYRSYQMDQFAANINTTGPFLSNVKGTGIGFDLLLRDLPWQKLN
ncbi:o-succinylbenzoate synthase MenC [Bdellovibrio sp. HCB185ZH]|uniref:o-succinylbenzoate synthase MenC n=1 Tax=Bdellovibrio sp. HCB185ZH TaxID=3394235 RepID=UPI0039A43D4A